MKRWVWWAWLALVAACVVQLTRITVVTDVSSFLPGPANAAQRLMVGQLRDGLSTRIMLIGLRLDQGPQNAAPGAPQSAALVAASRALRDKLAGDRRLAWVSNGDVEALATERERLFAARYLLSPGVDQQLFSSTGLAQAFAQLEQALISARGAAIKPIAAADPTLAAVQLLDKASRQLTPLGGAGVWLGSGGTVALLLMETSAKGHDIAAVRETILWARKSAEEVLRQWPPGDPPPQIDFAGSAYFNVLSHDAIGKDGQRLSVLAMVLVAVLLLWALRSPRFLALALIPVASGALAGYAVVGMVDGTIHGITLAFGVTLIGEAVDYAIYTFVQSDHRGRQSARFWRQVLLAVLTSMIGFAAMYFSGFAGLRQLGLFSMAGLLAAAACTRWLLPGLLPRNERNAPSNRFAWLPSLSRRLRSLRWPVLLLALPMAVLLAQRGDGIWHDSLDSLSSSSPRDSARDLRYREDIDLPDLRSMIVVHGANLEDALRRTEAMTRVLDALVLAKSLGGYDSPTDVLPSHALQQRRQAALPAPDRLRTQVREAVSAGKLKAAAFEPFIDAVAAARVMPLVDQSYYDGTILGHWLDAQIARSADGVDVLVLLRGASSTIEVKQKLDAAGLAGVTLLDLKADVEVLVKEYRQRAMQSSLIGTAVIFLVLVLQLRRARAVASMLATIVSTILITVTILLHVEGRLTVFNLVALLLVVGVASNYTLFFSTLSSDAVERQRASVSVVLAATSTFIGFGALATSSTPVLAMIGLTVSIGVAAGLVTSMVFSADSRGNAE